MNAMLYPDYKQAVADILAEGVEAGKLISHEWLDEHLRLDANSSDFPFKRLAGIEAFKKTLLLEHKIDLKNVRGEGYMIIATENQTRVALDDTITGIGKTIKRGMLRLTNTNIEKLADEGRRENVDAVSRLAALGGMTKRRIKA